VRTRKIQFGPEDTLGGTAPLIMLRDIEGFQPRRRRSRRGWGVGVLFLLALASLALLVILEELQRGALSALLH
jgi:hypothetical protein